MAVAGALALVCGGSPPSSRADTVELRNGQRIEGSVREANASSVVIESGGRVLVLPREQVAAVYFNPPAAAAPSHPSPVRGDLLQALDAVRTLTQNPAVQHAAYARAVTEAKVVLDRYLQESDVNSSLRALVSDAWALYAVASSAWEARNTHNANLSIGVGQDPVLERCPGLQSVLAKHPAPADRGAALRRGVAMESELGTLWTCAAERLAEAERAVR